MKLSGFAVLAAIAASALAAAPVLAQEHVEMHRTTTVTTHHGMSHMDHGKRRVCHTRWVHHHKVRKCTWQRW